MKKYWKTHKDWIALAVLVILAAVTLLIANSIKERPEPRLPFSGGEYTTFSESKKPVDPRFPAPSGEERDFYKTYLAGRFQYSIEPLVINSSRNTNLERPVFRVRILNTTNNNSHASEKEARTLSIGCVATSEPYKMETVLVKDVTVNPLSWLDVEISVNQTCVYIGNADGSGFWRLY